MNGPLGLAALARKHPERIVVLDTETTGINIGRDEILSVAIVDGDGKELLSALARPVRHTSWRQAQQVNGISPEMVQSAPTLRDISTDIRSYINDLHVIVAYNARFDLGMLKAQKAIDTYPAHVFDVMKEFALVHGTKRSPYGTGYLWSSLEDCARFYGYRFNPHDALEDARATAYCFRSLLNDKCYIQRHG